MWRDWQRDEEVNGIVVVFAVAGMGIVEFGSFPGKETGIAVVAASWVESFSCRNKDLVLALHFRRSKDVGSASWRKAGGEV